MILKVSPRMSCDNELRIRLNGKGKYFRVNGKLIGHEYLRPTIKRIYPMWKDYLNKPESNLKKLAVSLSHCK